MNLAKPHKPNHRPERWIPVVKPLWEAGLSTRQIAKAIDMSYSYVYRICLMAGLHRSQSEAALLRQPPKSKHWRSARQVARKKMQRALGRKLDRNEHVHHKDKDYTNNDLSNLEVINASDHLKLHNPKNPIPRHVRRKEYMKAYLHEYNKTYVKPNKRQS